MAQKIFDIQQIVGGNVPIGGRIYIGAYGENPVDSPGYVFTDRDATTSIITPLRIGSDGRPVNGAGDPLVLYADGSYSMQIRDQYDADVFASPWQVEVLDVDADGNARINILQPESVDASSSVGTSANPYDAGYFDFIRITNTPEVGDIAFATNVDYVNGVAALKKNAASDSATGTEVSFVYDTIYNATAAATGNITHNLTGARAGTEVTIYHNDSAAPTYPAEWVMLGAGSYATSELNIIIARFVSATRIEYIITQES